MSSVSKQATVYFKYSPKRIAVSREFHPDGPGLSVVAFSFLCYLRPVLVIVHDLYVVGISIAPGEADSIVLVDSNAVLVPTISLERFQSVTQRFRPVDLLP